MTRNLKALGLALMAVFAMSAIGAQAASADLFTSEEEKTVLTGNETNEHRFTIWGGFTTCKEAFFEGTVEGKEKPEATVHPEYGECEDSFGSELTVDTEGCFYKLGTETVEGHAPVTIECLEGHSITLRSVNTGCHITVHEQGPLYGVTYKDGTNPATGKEDVTVTATVEGIHYTTNIICQFGGLTGTDTDGFYEGAVTVDGFKDEGTSGTATTGTTFNEGAAVNIGADTG